MAAGAALTQTPGVKTLWRSMGKLHQWMAGLQLAIKTLSPGPFPPAVA
ncbi:MAG: hypothetical protein KME45_21900 [Stenomitos rutilans HA7619-LM2]|nr:hypothetical protein [Stenomitos rutilans HA7619-LM2]